MFNNINDAITWVSTQVKFREKTDLSIMNLAFRKLDLDLSNIKKVHIAGTNGKGSTNAFLSEILIENNLKVGSFTSPYLVVFNERIKINNENIKDSDLLNYINYFYQFNLELYALNNIKLSFFEILTLLSLKYFHDNHVDVIIMETGIGGRLDATNILNYDASIITSIGFDHVEQLGDTLEKIASEKVHILKENGYLIAAVSEEIKLQYSLYARNINAQIKFIDDNSINLIDNNTFKYLNNTYKINLLGDYQRMNSVLAINAAKYLYNIDDNIIEKALINTKWPGRLEEISDNVYIDGAHNDPAIKALTRNIKTIFKNKDITILFSALKGKDVLGMLNELSLVSEKIVLTSFPDFRFESLSKYQTNEIAYFEDGLKQLNLLIENKKANEVIIVTGSLHFIGYIKKYF